MNKKKSDSYDHFFIFASVSFFVVPPRHGRYSGNLQTFCKFTSSGISARKKMWWLPSVRDTSKPKPSTRLTISANFMFLEPPIIFWSSFRLFIDHLSQAWYYSTTRSGIRIWFLHTIHQPVFTISEIKKITCNSCTNFWKNSSFELKRYLWDSRSGNIPVFDNYSIGEPFIHNSDSLKSRSYVWIYVNSTIPKVSKYSL